MFLVVDVFKRLKLAINVLGGFSVPLASIPKLQATQINLTALIGKKILREDECNETINFEAWQLEL